MNRASKTQEGAAISAGEGTGRLSVRTSRGRPWVSARWENWISTSFSIPRCLPSNSLITNVHNATFVVFRFSSDADGPSVEDQ